MSYIAAPIIYSGNDLALERVHRCNNQCEFMCDCGRELCLDSFETKLYRVQGITCCIGCYLAEVETSTLSGVAI